MWLFKKDKFNSLTHEDVSDAILKLETQMNEIEINLAEKDKSIELLVDKGKKEKSQETKLFLAKKITFLQEEKKSEIQRATFLMYNIKLMNQLRVAVDDNCFFGKMSGNGLNNLLSDQKGLANFLNKALDTKVSAENVLTEADDLFSEIQNSFSENEQIYGQNQKDSMLLALFETDSATTDQQEFNEIEVTRKESSGDR